MRMSIIANSVLLTLNDYLLILTHFGLYHIYYFRILCVSVPNHKIHFCFTDNTIKFPVKFTVQTGRQTYRQTNRQTNVLVYIYRYLNTFFKFKGKPKLLNNNYFINIHKKICVCYEQQM